MNWIKWFQCWYHKSHIMCSYRDTNGTAKRKCIRCGYEES